MKTTFDMSTEIDTGRRRFLTAAAIGVAGASLSAMRGARTGAAAGVSVHQVNAGLLNIGYFDEGRTDAPAVVLLHGWPYDIHSFVDVAPRLVSAGYRVIVPYLRGYGTTRFLSNGTFRNGQPAAVAMDAIELMNALKLEN